MWSWNIQWVLQKGVWVVACVDADADAAAASLAFFSKQNTHHIINHETTQIDNLAFVSIPNEGKTLCDPQCELVELFFHSLDLRSLYKD